MTYLLNFWDLLFTHQSSENMLYPIACVFPLLRGFVRGRGGEVAREGPLISQNFDKSASLNFFLST